MWIMHIMCRFFCDTIITCHTYGRIICSFFLVMIIGSHFSYLLKILFTNYFFLSWHDIHLLL